MSENKVMVRVYGLLVNEKNQVLLSDEKMGGMQFTKFPGGGLEPGEGTIDCLRREALEEMNQPIKNIEHFYTTDFYQASSFHKNTQIISVYYQFQLEGDQQFETVEKPFQWSRNLDKDEVFRWKNIGSIAETDLTFPIDRKVVQLIREKWG